MQCPKKGCGYALRFSFMDDVDQRPVYQCIAVGTQATIAIPTDRGMNTYLVHTLDHSDDFYVLDGVELLKVRPVRLSKKVGDALFRMRNFLPYVNDKGKKEYPIAWGVARA